MGVRTASYSKTGYEPKPCGTQSKSHDSYARMLLVVPILTVCFSYLGNCTNRQSYWSYFIHTWDHLSCLNAYVFRMLASIRVTKTKTCLKYIDLGHLTQWVSVISSMRTSPSSNSFFYSVSLFWSDQPLEHPSFINSRFHAFVSVCWSRINNILSIQSLFFLETSRIFNRYIN